MDVLIAPRVDAERILCKYVKRLRVWFNGRTFGCQSNDPGSIPGTRTISVRSACRAMFRLAL